MEAFLKQLASDTAVFFREFGETVRFCPIDGQEREMTAVFDDGFVPADIDGRGIESKQPELFCLESDVPEISHDDRFVIRGKNYSVTGIQPDGQGIVYLRMLSV